MSKEELKFNDPPEVLGRGSFGMVLLAEYRGTQVAVKRVIPPRSRRTNGRTSSTFWGRGNKNTTPGIFDAADETYQKDKKATHNIEEDANNSEVRTSNTNSGFTGTGSWAGMSMSVVSGVMSRAGALSMRGNDRKLKKNSKGPSLKQLKEEFMEEMRYLSKLRHPCVTTVMGAMIDKGEDPMVSFFTWNTHIMPTKSSDFNSHPCLWSSLSWNTWIMGRSMISCTTKQWQSMESYFCLSSGISHRVYDSFIRLTRNVSMGKC